MRIHLSYDPQDKEAVERFKALIGEDEDFTFLADSPPRLIVQDMAMEIKEEITELIKQASVTVCLISENTGTNPWINWELQVTEEHGKGIIGILLEDHPSPNDWPEFFRLRIKYEILPLAKQKKMRKALERAERNSPGESYFTVG